MYCILVITYQQLDDILLQKVKHFITVRMLVIHIVSNVVRSNHTKVE